MKVRAFTDTNVWALAVGFIRYGYREYGIGFHIGPLIIEITWNRVQPDCA